MEKPINYMDNRGQAGEEKRPRITLAAVKNRRCKK